ncbi:MAG: VCBS repeat-containing protein, partial [Saprospiraceae bacterium]|nr:VCBS repeat-containing protein [Saprospiraceae bacterium]
LFLACQSKVDKENLVMNKMPDYQHHIIDAGYKNNPWTKIIADLDNDGLEDVIIGGQKGPLVWYHNPDWSKQLITSGGYQTVDGEAGDLDNDGDQDIVMGGLLWYENPGENTAKEWNAHLIAEHPTHDVELADLNQDGLLDIVTRNQSDFGTRKGNSIHLWYQRTAQPWEEVILECPHGEGLKVIDLDDDQDADIIGGGFWFENSAEWTKHNFANWHASANLDAGDFNADGRIDVVLTPSELAGQTYRISWFEQPENITDSSWNEHLLTNKMECVIHGVAAADFNQDGLDDIAYAEMHQGVDPDDVVILINKSRGEQWNKMIISEKGSHSIQTADLNNDHYPDVLGANWSGAYQPIEIWISHFN